MLFQAEVILVSAEIIVLTKPFGILVVGLGALIQMGTVFVQRRFGRFAHWPAEPAPFQNSDGSAPNRHVRHVFVPGPPFSTHFYKGAEELFAHGVIPWWIGEGNQRPDDGLLNLRMSFLLFTAPQILRHGQHSNHSFYAASKVAMQVVCGKRCTMFLPVKGTSNGERAFLITFVQMAKL